jgi:outer membrane biosynthesis protein TonB
MSNPRSLTRTRISSATGAGAVRSPFGVIGAVSLHVLIIAGAFYTFSHRFEISEPSDVVPVELVTIGAKTNVMPTVQKKDVVEQPKEEPQPPPPEQKAEIAPSEPEIVKKPPPVLPTPKTIPPTRKQSEEQAFNDLMGKLSKQQKAPANAKPSDRTTKGIGTMNADTADLVAYLQGLVNACWNRPNGVPHPERLVLQLRVFLRPDGNVAQAPQLLTDSSGDPYWQAAVESAKRAVYVCQPYKLPPDRYGEWKDIVMNFDPSQQ